MKKLILLGSVAFGAALVASDASADFDTADQGTKCQPINAAASADLTFDSYGVSNQSTTVAHKVVCPVTDRRTSAVGNAYLHIKAYDRNSLLFDPQNGVGAVDCYLFKLFSSGDVEASWNLKTSTGGPGTGVQTLSLLLGSITTSHSFQLQCSIPRKGGAGGEHYSWLVNYRLNNSPP